MGKKEELIKAIANNNLSDASIEAIQQQLDRQIKIDRSFETAKYPKKITDNSKSTLSDFGLGK